MNDYEPKCIYCSAWTHSSVIKREDEQQTKHKVVKRKCVINHTTISIKSKACMYFKPASCFYCNKNNHYMAFLSCLNRRYNPDKFNSFEKCTNCRQFSKDIKHIIENFWINKMKITHPSIYVQKGHRTIKRRDKPKRVIKRRDKPKRVIKRR